MFRKLDISPILPDKLERYINDIKYERLPVPEWSDLFVSKSCDTEPDKITSLVIKPPNHQNSYIEESRSSSCASWDNS